jgi:hypothetical protein
VTDIVEVLPTVVRPVLVPPTWRRHLGPVVAGAAILLMAAGGLAAGGDVSLAHGPVTNAASDRAFLDALRQDGVPTLSDAEAVGLGRQVCSYLDRGSGSTVVVRGLTTDHAALRYTNQQATALVRASIGSYCPQDG